MALKGLLGKKQETVAGGLEPSPQIDLDPVATEYAADPMGQGYPGHAQGVPAQGIPGQPFVAQAAAQVPDPAIQPAQGVAPGPMVQPAQAAPDSAAQSALAAQAATEALDGNGNKGKKAKKDRGKKGKKAKDDPDARPDLSKLKKKELLEILVAQGEEIDALRARAAELEAQLANRQFDMQRVGSLAEASVQVADIFKDAEEAARIYLENIRRRYV